MHSHSEAHKYKTINEKLFANSAAAFIAFRNSLENNKKKKQTKKSSIKVENANKIETSMSIISTHIEVMLINQNFY